MALLFVAGVVHGCSGGADGRQSEASPSAAASAAGANHFEWAMRLSTPTFEETETKLTETTGAIALGFDRWACRYTIERQAEANSPTQEFGFVSCQLKGTGEMVETMALCSDAENRRPDCGTSELRISDDSGALHQIELRCQSRSSDCGKRPRITDRTESRLAAATSPSTDRMGHFEWRLEVGEVGGRSSTQAIASRRGSVEAGPAGWQCSYSIAQQSDPTYPELELGFTTCKAKDSTDTVQLLLLCAENQERPSACNVGLLRLAREGGATHNLVMSCRNPKNPCW
jgi:hypothetical protein